MCVKMAGETEKMAPFETANFRQVRVKFVNSQTKVQKKSETESESCVHERGLEREGE